jgi:hypothetical protein
VGETLASPTTDALSDDRRIGCSYDGRVDRGVVAPDTAGVQRSVQARSPGAPVLVLVYQAPAVWQESVDQPYVRAQQPGELVEPAPDLTALFPVGRTLQVPEMPVPQQCAIRSDCIDHAMSDREKSPVAPQPLATISEGASPRSEIRTAGPRQRAFPPLHVE